MSRIIPVEELDRITHGVSRWHTCPPDIDPRDWDGEGGEGHVSLLADDWDRLLAHIAAQEPVVEAARKYRASYVGIGESVTRQADRQVALFAAVDALASPAARGTVGKGAGDDDTN